MLDDFARLSGDPFRTLNCLEELLHKSPRMEGRPEILRPAAILFGASRFLANFCIQNPQMLEQAVHELVRPVDREMIAGYMAANPLPMEMSEAMSYLRLLKKRMLLRIALRDLLHKDELPGIMRELSVLADLLIGAALQVATHKMKGRYGDPVKDRFSVVALGKLGGNELNFSSDVDLIYIYGHDKGETSGVLSSGGIRRNRISNHEYYCRLGETLGRVLSASTADGLVHRVDLRLRPEGTRGDLALSLGSYELYYESYGREWERAVLLKARPVAGDEALGRGFLDTIEPFVYRRHLDFSTIEELKNMKHRIDSSASVEDIKRGRGGIREIEFFVQSFQLIYGGKEPVIRERSTLKALDILHQKGMADDDAHRRLTEAYVFLRTLEHRMQMVQDLQTHSMPAEDKAVLALARNMGLQDGPALKKRLSSHRGHVNSIFRSLFHEEEEEAITEDATASAILLAEELSAEEIAERLSGFDFADNERAVKNIASIRNLALFNQTARSRRILGQIMPGLLGRVRESADPDQALDFLQMFLESVGTNASYLSVLAEDTPLAGHLITLFAEASYLARHFVSHPELLDLLREQGVYGSRTLRALKRDLDVTIHHSRDWSFALRLFKLMEETRLGLLYLNGEIGLTRLLRGLSKTAEAVLTETFRAAERELDDGTPRPAGSMAVIGLGKLGGRELTYGSDLDIIFVHSGEGQDYFTRLAERIVKALSEYTRTGIAYKVDTRLRPTGSKGPLVQDLLASRRYYIEESELWERQALLRARPVAGDLSLGARFFWVAREAVAVGAKEGDLAGEIRTMRSRIEAELARDRGTYYDLKFGPGGLNELEFTIQYLQLKFVKERPQVVVPNTPLALRRLKDYGFLAEKDAVQMESIYRFYREMETMVRLMGLGGVPKEGPGLEELTRKMKRISGAGLESELLSAREKIRNLWEMLVA